MMGVAAALIIKWNLPAVTPNKPQKKSDEVDPGIGQKIKGNQIQDGHLG
jgi:hypothetical protein